MLILRTAVSWEIRIHFIRMEKTVVSIMKDAISKEQSTLSLDGLLPCLKTVLFTV